MRPREKCLNYLVVRLNSVLLNIKAAINFKSQVCVLYKRKVYFCNYAVHMSNL